MAVVDKRIGAPGTKMPFGAGGQGFVLRRKFDFESVPAGSGDTIQMLDIPINTHVLAVNVNITQVEDSTAVCSVGDGNDAGVAVQSDAFMAGVDLEVLGMSSSKTHNSAGYNEVAPVGHGKAFTAAGVIQLLLSAACDTAKGEVSAICIPM